MPAPSRSKERKHQDLSIVAKQRLEGKTFGQIAHYINENFPRLTVYDEQMAKKDYAEIVRMTDKQIVEDGGNAFTEEVMWRRNFNAVMWERFYASMGVQEKRHTDILTIESGRVGPDGTPVTGQTRKRSQLTQTELIGDPRFAQLLLANQRELSELLGVRDSEGVNVNVGVGVTVVEKPEFGEREEEAAYRIFMELEEQRNAHMIESSAGATNGVEKPDLNW